MGLVFSWLVGWVFLVGGWFIRTDIGGYAGEDDLAFILGLNGRFEVGVVPGVYFAVSLYERRVGVETEDFLW